MGKHHTFFSSENGNFYSQGHSYCNCLIVISAQMLYKLTSSLENLSWGFLWDTNQTEQQMIVRG